MVLEVSVVRYYNLYGTSMVPMETGLAEGFKKATFGKQKKKLRKEYI